MASSTFGGSSATRSYAETGCGEISSKPNSRPKQHLLCRCCRVFHSSRRTAEESNLSTCSGRASEASAGACVSSIPFCKRSKSERRAASGPGCPGERFGTTVSSVYFPVTMPGEAMRRLLLLGACHHGFGGCSQDFANEKKIREQRAQMAGGV